MHSHSLWICSLLLQSQKHAAHLVTHSEKAAALTQIPVPATMIAVIPAETTIATTPATIAATILATTPAIIAATIHAETTALVAEDNTVRKAN